MTSQITGIDNLRILAKKVLNMREVVILGTTSEDGMNLEDIQKLGSMKIVSVKYF